MTFRVATRAREPSVALDRTSARMRRVIAAVKAEGIPAADIKTGGVGLSRIRIKTRNGHHRRIYRAVNSIRVTIRHVQTTGDVIQAAVEAGATSFSGIHLSSSKADELYRNALGDAFDDARVKAQILADHAGATLGAAQEITEGADAFNNGNQQQATSGSVGTPIEPGTTEIFAHVTVTFALE
jgi:uncharacterized protein YggE